MTRPTLPARVLAVLLAAGMFLAQGVAATADSDSVDRIPMRRTAVPETAAPSDADLASDRVTVVFREGVDPHRAARDVATRARQRGAERVSVGSVGAASGSAVFEGVPANGLDELSADPLIEAVSPDRRMVAMLARTTVVVGSDRTLASGLDGQGQTVAVIDTGIDTTHPAFAGAVVAEACFVADDSCPNGAGEQIGTGAAMPCSGGGCAHGTHVAGIVAARAQKGQPSGVAPGAKLIAVRVFSEAGDTSSVEVNHALSWVVEQTGKHTIAAVNLSLGYDRKRSGAGFASPCDSHLEADPAMLTLIRRLRDAGVVTVAASGNSAFDNTMSFPACLADTISVGASTNADTLTSFSNVSSGTDLFAPGLDVRAPVPEGGYAPMSGTSMSAPHVAGAVAVLRQRSPAATPRAIRRALTQTGTAIETPVGPKPRLDVHRARLSPSRPSPSVATHGDRRAVVSWGAASRRTGSAITGYRVTAEPGGKQVIVGSSTHSATITGLDNGTRYTFTVRAINELVSGAHSESNLIIPKPPPPHHGFADVPTNSYFNQSVRWLKAERVTDGYGKTGTYAPDVTVTRAQMAAFLWRSMDAPTGYPHHKFTDVSGSSYYSDAVRWLKAEGITDGYGKTGTYAPDVTVTRAQMAAFLWRMNGKPTGYPHHKFTDVSGSSYYSDAVRWLKAEGITDGYGKTGTYAPDVTVTRAQMAAFLHRLSTTPSAWERAPHIPSSIAF
jgi:subtilisin family serine protease